MTVCECILGIDPSLTGTGVALAVSGCAIETRVFGSAPATRVRARVGRYRVVVSPILEWLSERDLRPSLCVIEGYAFGLRSRGVFDRCEFGGVLRDRLDPFVGQWLEITPAQLKRYTTGSGAADKAAMRAAIHRKWGRDIKQADEADAYALCQLGLEMTGYRAPGVDLDAQVARMVDEVSPPRRAARGVR